MFTTTVLFQKSERQITYVIQRFLYARTCGYEIGRDAGLAGQRFELSRNAEQVFGFWKVDMFSDTSRPPILLALCSQ
jgi:hypothetical protein